MAQRAGTDSFPWRRITIRLRRSAYRIFCLRWPARSNSLIWRLGEFQYEVILEPFNVAPDKCHKE